VHHREGSLVILLQLGSLNLIDYAELDRRDVEAGRAAASTAIAEIRASLKTSAPTE
jgi:hypothetical protein